MENNDMLMSSVIVGGFVFVAFILIWFTGVYLKKRFRAETGDGGLQAPEGASAWEEKRSAPRLSVSWHATLTSTEATFPVQLKDISQGGAFAACKTPLPLKERIRLAVDVPGGSPISLNAMVVWSNAGVPAEKVVNRGMGIRFVDNEEAVRKQLKAALAQVVALAKTATL